MAADKKRTGKGKGGKGISEDEGFHFLLLPLTFPLSPML
jgi:hypothetical protein